ncbi:hypothetical protein WICPIJ_001029, partial [Wickerhamomyces pijperi]
TNRETISSNYSKLLSILQNPTPEYLWNHSGEPSLPQHPNFKSLEEIYVFNSGINLLTKSCSTLKRVFVAKPSNPKNISDEYYKFIGLLKVLNKNLESYVNEDDRFIEMNLAELEEGSIIELY